MKYIEQELENLQGFIIKGITDDKNKIAGDISEYISAKSKRLRPSMVFMFSKALGINTDDEVYNLAAAVELVHNSTLVHDDIIDNADTRRGHVSLNFKLGNNLSVLAGDILLSIALFHLIKCNNTESVNIFAKTIYNMCKGEINQNFSIGKVPTFEEYIMKSRYKTAELFKAPLVSLCCIKNIKEKDAIEKFADNFGIAFQIKDDLLNVLTTDNTKPVMSDVRNGIYTAPVLYLNEDFPVEELSEEEIIQKLSADKKYITKTVALIKEYADKAVSAIDFIPDNKYKQEIILSAENLYKAGINE